MSWTMPYRTVLLTVFLSVAGMSSAAAQFSLQGAYVDLPAPSAPDTSSGTHAITWTGQWGAAPYCEGPHVIEKAGVHGEWTAVGDGDCDGQLVLTRPEGNYFYRLSWLEFVYVEWWGYFVLHYSDSIETVVSAGANPSQQPFSQQLAYTYTVRQGDIDGNGLTDLFIERTAGGLVGDGAIYRAILRQIAGQRFDPIVPNAAQVAVASGWPSAPVQILLDDFNLDGFVDLLLKSVSSVVTGAADQFVFSSGRLFFSKPQGVAAVDATMQSFLSEFTTWNINPSYFVQNAPIVPYVVFTQGQWCWPFSGPDYSHYDWQCFTYPIVYVTYEQDFSAFNQDAVTLSGAFGPSAGGGFAAAVQAGSESARLLHDVYRKVFGVDVLRGALRSGCNGGVLAYSPSVSIDCIDQDAVGEAYLALVYRIADAIGPPQQNGCRFITTGEIQVVGSQGLPINNIASVKICPFAWIGLASRYVMAPNGNVYVGPGNVTNMIWSPDYSLAGTSQMGKLLHELVHVYQVKTLGYSIPEMIARAGFARTQPGDGYKYWNQSPPGFINPIWNTNNIEQQAQSFEDRYRLCQGLTSVAQPSLNGGVTKVDLVGFVPFPSVCP